MPIVHWIYLMHLVDAFIQSDMHCIQGSFYQSVSHVLGIASFLLIYRSYYIAFCSEKMFEIKSQRQIPPVVVRNLIFKLSLVSLLCVSASLLSQ